MLPVIKFYIIKNKQNTGMMYEILMIEFICPFLVFVDIASCTESTALMNFNFLVHTYSSELKFVCTF